MNIPYIIVTASYPQYLANQVNEHIKQGYQPTGGVTYYKNNHNEEQFIQAMIFVD